MNQRIIEFLETQRVATVSCVDEENKPYCFNCFYAFDKQKNVLYFKSSSNTLHVQLLSNKQTVAGTILPDKLNQLALAGIQFRGEAVINANDATSFYHNKYPFARVMSGDVWTIRLQQIKMTDNTLKFGKKILWEANVAEAI